MAEVGGKGLAANLRMKLPELRKRADEARLRVAGAVDGFLAEVDNVEKAAKSLEDEAADMRNATSEILGNNPPVGDS